MKKKSFQSFFFAIVALLAGSVPAWPYSLFENGARASNDARPVEVGVRFVADTNGEITAIRFFRHVASPDGYTVRVWDAGCRLLAEARAVEGQSPVPGWQTVQLWPPVPVAAGQVYIASYYTASGRYTLTLDYFAERSIRVGPLRLVENEQGSASAYIYGAGGGCPTRSFRESNYWVDIIFELGP